MIKRENESDGTALSQTWENDSKEKLAAKPRTQPKRNKILYFLHSDVSILLRTNANILASHAIRYSVPGSRAGNGIVLCLYLRL